MFENATRQKYRFPYRGEIDVEDLWDLRVTDLDRVFKSLNSQLKQTKEESLLETKSEEDVELQTKIDIIKYIVKVKLEEQKLREEANDRADKKQRILEILKTKQDESLQSKSEEELEKMLDEL